jgi:hypothetical protein
MSEANFITPPIGSKPTKPHPGFPPLSPSYQAAGTGGIRGRRKRE